MHIYTHRIEKVEAIQLTKENVAEVANWCGGYVVAEQNPVTDDIYVAMNVPSLNGPFRLGEGEYLIRDKHGRFSSMLAEDFESTFEKG